MNSGLPFEMTKIFATLLAVVFFPFAIVDFFKGTVSWQFWLIVGGTFGIAVILFAILEYWLNHG